MILPAQTIRRLCTPPELLARIRPPMVQPFHERTKSHGMTFGLGPAGYDVRIAQEVYLVPGEFALASTVEQFDMPTNVLGQVEGSTDHPYEGKYQDQAAGPQEAILDQ